MWDWCYGNFGYMWLEGKCFDSHILKNYIILHINFYKPSFTSFWRQIEAEQLSQLFFSYERQKSLLLVALRQKREKAV